MLKLAISAVDFPSVIFVEKADGIFADVVTGVGLGFVVGVGVGVAVGSGVGEGEGEGEGVAAAVVSFVVADVVSCFVVAVTEVMGVDSDEAFVPPENIVAAFETASEYGRSRPSSN